MLLSRTGPAEERLLSLADLPDPARPRTARCWSRSRRAASAGPTCTSSRARCARRCRWCRGTRRRKHRRAGRWRRCVRRRRCRWRRLAVRGTTCGTCAFCASGRENLCRDARFTGRDAHGGLAQRMVADARYIYGLPPSFTAMKRRRCCAPASSAIARCGCGDQAGRAARADRLRRVGAPGDPGSAALGVRGVRVHARSIIARWR